jgi:hypothetical protein
MLHAYVHNTLTPYAVAHISACEHITLTIALCCVVVVLAGEGLQSAADKAGSKVGGAVESVKGLGSEAADTARATGEVDTVHADSLLWLAASDHSAYRRGQMLNSSASQSPGLQSGTAGMKHCVAACKGLRHNLQQPAQAGCICDAQIHNVVCMPCCLPLPIPAGEVISMEVSEATDAVKDKAHQATSRVSDATRDAKHSAQDTAQRTAEAVHDVKHSAQGTAQDTADAARSTADRASTATKNAASRTGDSARDAGNTAADAANRAYGSVADVANRAGESVREGAAAVGDKVQQGVDAAAEGTGYVVGAGSEKMSDAQEAAARAGEKGKCNVVSDAVGWWCWDCDPSEHSSTVLLVICSVAFMPARHDDQLLFSDSTGYNKPTLALFCSKNFAALVME